MPTTKEDTTLNREVSKLAKTLSKQAGLVFKKDAADRFYNELLSGAKSTNNLFKNLAKTVSDQKHITHEVEWLFDNFYLIDGAVTDILQSSTKKNFRKLPLVVQDEKYVPRLYFILTELLALTKNELDRDLLYRFLKDYQKTAPLSIMELRAVPLFLKIITVEKAGTLVKKSTLSLKEREDAEKWFKLIQKRVGKNSPPEYHEITNLLVKNFGVIPVDFGFHLIQLLSGEGKKMKPIIKWLKLNLLKQGIAVEKLADMESKARSKNMNLLGNIVGSLRWVNQTRWEEFVGNVNTIDGILKKDPAGLFAVCSKQTLENYREVILKISERTGIHEAEVAKVALNMSRAEHSGSDSAAKGHVGYYLVDEGRKDLEKKLKYNPSTGEKTHRFILENASILYFGCIGFLTAILSIVWGFVLALNTALSGYSLFATILLSVFLNIELATVFVNNLVAKFLPVQRLPRVDYSLITDKIPPTAVVVPAMFSDEESLEDLFLRLEAHFLGNPEKNLYYAALLDFKDAGDEKTAKDKVLVERAEQEIERLNKKYSVNGPRFFFFYRKRLWNPSEKVFMGWERKRGKLKEFGQLILGSKKTSFVNGEDISKFPKIEYILTLDEDTELPRETVRELIGVIHHPLNKAVLDESGNVARGYGIIQPKVSTRFRTAHKNYFSRLFSNTPGIDSYSNSVSADVYQDLFRNSIFYGKGIFDVRAVEESIGGKIQENTVLSHDLLEGLYAKTGFAGDVQLFENFLTSYHEYILRLHRWIRGDWQIMWWLTRKKTQNGGANNFNTVDKWRIFDNLRRSFNPIALLLLIGLGFFSTGSSTAFISFYVLTILAFPVFFPYILGFFSWEKNTTMLWRLKTRFKNLLSVIARIASKVLFLLHHAFVSADAILRALVRMHVTKKRLLQWRTAGEVSRKLKGSIWETYSAMWQVQVLALFALLAVLLVEPINYFALFWAVVFAASPTGAYMLSKGGKRDITFNKSDEEFLRLSACKTYRYFMKFAGQENNWLAADRFQEEPKPRNVDTKSVTSPTNIGMQLVAVLSSYDFGFMGLGEFSERISNTSQSLSEMERHKGHFYNWYDVKTLKPLPPGYVSTVDSANMLMSLVVLKEGVKDILDKPFLGQKNINGLKDVLNLMLVDSRTLLEEGSLDRDVKRVIFYIIKETEEALNAIKKVDKVRTSDELNDLLSSLSGYKRNMEKSVFELRTLSGGETVLDVYLTMEHFSSLLDENIKDISTFLPFSLLSHSKPMDNTEKSNLEFHSTYKKLYDALDTLPSVGEVASGKLRERIVSLKFDDAVTRSNLEDVEKDALMGWYQNLLRELDSAEEKALEIKRSLEKIIDIAEEFFRSADFRLLYNEERGLFHIGYNAAFDKHDNSFYDFMASEANGISFVAIMKGHVPKKHWFFLERKTARYGNMPALVSWGGSLFEYLTSLLFYDAHEDSLLGQASRTAVRAHFSYGKKKNTPWGIGESAYSVTNAKKEYQYQIFGVPGLGLKRGLGDYLVVSPYTSALSLLVEPKLAVKNLKRLFRSKVWGWYGFYDSVDYTGTKDKRFLSKKGTPVKIHYAHHQGFILAALSNALNDKKIRKLFHADPGVRATDFLFEEKAVETLPKKPIQTIADYGVKRGTSEHLGPYPNLYIPPKTQFPRYAFLSNGSYSVAVSNSGAGFSKQGSINLTRFRGDHFSEKYGTFIAIKDTETEDIWSPTVRPMGSLGKQDKIIFSENKAEIHSLHNDVKSIVRVVVPSEDDVEIRQLTLANTGKTTKELAVASFGEVVLAPENMDKSHTLFQRLFVKSEFIKRFNALIFSRENIPEEGKKSYFMHILSSPPFGRENENICYGRNREAFFGARGDTVKPSMNLTPAEESDNLPDYTLDPGFSLQKTVTLKPGETTHVVFVSGASDNREELVKLIKKYSNQWNAVSALEKTIRSHPEELKNIGISYGDAMVFQELASKVLSKKEWHEEPKNDDFRINHLWRNSISGVFPIIVLKVRDVEDVPAIKEILLFHKYMKYKGIKIDIVILNEHPASYLKILDDEIDFLIRYTGTEVQENKGGRVFHVKSDLISQHDKDAIIALSRTVLEGKEGKLKNQLQTKKTRQNASKVSKFKPKYKTGTYTDIEQESDHKFDSKSYTKTNRLNLLSDNGYGGFDPATGEYVIRVSKDRTPLTPWVNIIANKNFGFVIGESGSTYTWAENSYEGRITALANEPLLDDSSEILYLRDEETGEVWSPTPAPIRSKHEYIVRHGFGYTSFAHSRTGLDHELKVFVPPEDKVKIFNLKIKNNSPKTRHISATSFFDLSLGTDKDRQLHRFFRDNETGSLVVENPLRTNFWNDSYKSRVAIDMNFGQFVCTNDRDEFLGRYGSIESPRAMKKQRLSGNILPDVDSCAATQAFLKIASGEEKEITIVIAESGDLESLRGLIKKYRSSGIVKEELKKTKENWNDILSPVKLKSPDKSLDLIFNGWLLYQSMTSRMLAKTGFYQPSGAFGFRDQLQDSLAFVWSKPQVTRDMVLKAARRQFVEGDVLNWWHEHNNFGTRTLSADQYLWLPYAVMKYLQTTGDYSILEERTPFIKGPSVDFSDRHSWTGIPEESHESGTVYEHIIRALEKGFRFGEHGIPLMGGGDWNDGMNRVGIQGKGESIWLGWFLAVLLNYFADILEHKEDKTRAERYRTLATSITESVEEHGWDGEWYRRAYHDSGVILGSMSNKEFKIDSLVQSWAVISGLGAEDRRETALNHAQKLLSPDNKLMRLIAPPLDNFPVDVGYIKDYPAGVRENGAQYNHAALWFAEALAIAGRGDDAYKILDMINPVKRSESREKSEVYRVEPYVVASDIYSDPNYAYRGGWTWYTGSAGIFYRVVFERILGIKINEGKMSFDPCLPSEWNECSLEYKFGSSVYHINIKRTEEYKVELNGNTVPENNIELLDDGKEHVVDVFIAKDSSVANKTLTQKE